MIIKKDMKSVTSNDLATDPPEKPKIIHVTDPM